MKLKVSSIIKIGIAIFLTLFILIWGLNYLKGTNFFKSEAEYLVEYEKVDGLQNSADILIKGYKIGQVTKIILNHNNNYSLIVKFIVNNDIKIPKNSIAKIFSSDLMGTKSIELLLSDSLDYYQPGDTLQGALEGGLKEQVSIQMLPLKNQAEDLMEEIEKAIVVVQSVFNENTIDNLTKSIESIKYTIKNLETSSYSIDTLVQSEKVKLSNIFTYMESITHNLQNNNAALTNAFQNISMISDSLAKSNIKSALITTAAAFEKVDSIVEKINNGTGSLGLLVNNDTLYYNLEDAAYNLDKLVEDLRVNPKRYVHFSVFDFGKNVQGKVDTKSSRSDKVFYKVLLLTSNKPIALNPDNFQGIEKVEEFIDAGTYQYMTGSKRTLEKAKKLFEEIKLKYPEAKLVVFKKGERIILD